MTVLDFFFAINFELLKVRGLTANNCLGLLFLEAGGRKYIFAKAVKKKMQSYLRSVIFDISFNVIKT